MHVTKHNPVRMRPTRRGSVLLLVVGLLTILAMLGTSFLLVTRLNRKTTAALQSDKLDVYAKAVAGQVALTIKDDLCFNASGAYGDANTPLKFVDALSREPGGDDWLASHFTKSDGSWYQITDYGSGSGTYRNVAQQGLQDTDKDRLKDSRLVSTGLFNRLGNYIYAAVRVVDLSGLINLNIATTGYTDWTDGNFPPYISPVAIDLKSLIGQGVYDRLNNARTNGSGTSPLNINRNIGLRQADPLNDAEPFGPGNEWYCRYLGEIYSATIRQGELYDATEVNGAPLPVTQVRYMTNKSVSRSILRQHTANIAQPLPFWTVDASGNETNNADVLDNATVRGELVTLLSGMISPDGEKRAAHYVANLWAYLDGQDPAKAYKVVKGSTTAYGVVPQPVITEAFAKGERDGEGNLTEVQAVEIFNPTDQTLTNYKLKRGGSTFSLPSLPPGYTVVVNKTGSPDNVFFPAPTVTPLEDPVVDFTSNPVELWRTAESEEIKMDSVELDYDRPANGQTEGPTGKMRDTHRNRARYLVRKYKEYSSTTHTLGDSNTVDTATDLPDVMQGFTIAEPIKSGGDVFVHSLGELQDIFFVGPEGSTQSLPEALDDFTAKVSRGKPSTENDSTAGGLYPAIPWGMMLAEFFDCVPTDPVLTGSGGKKYYHWGKININTAPVGTLIRLPWPTFVDYDYDGFQDAGEPSLSLSADDKRAIAEEIIDYRQDNGPYLTPGAVQQALVEYARNNPTLMNLLEGATLDDKEKQWNYLPVVNCLYHRIANLITVRSDVFFIFIAIQDALVQKNALQKDIYLGYIDRSVCKEDGDAPTWVIISAW